MVYLLSTRSIIRSSSRLPFVFVAMGPLVPKLHRRHQPLVAVPLELLSLPTLSYSLGILSFLDLSLLVDAIHCRTLFFSQSPHLVTIYQ